MRCRLVGISGLLWVGLFAACGGSPGEEGLVSFTPLDCGRTSCTFDDPIAVGGRLALHIVGSENVSTAGIDVRASNPATLGVEGIPDVAGRPTWELTAIAAGEVDIIVFRPGENGGDDEDIDKLGIQITALARFGLQNFIGDAVGPGAPQGDFDEVWTVNADSPVSWRVTSFDSADVPAMGAFDFTVLLDPELANSLVDPNTSEGRLYVRPPAGSWTAEWTGDSQGLKVQIVSE